MAKPIKMVYDDYSNMTMVRYGMKTEKMGAGAFKTKCLSLLDEVEKRHLQLIITKHGKPMAKLVPIDDKKFSLHGCMKNSVVIKQNIVESTGEKWEAEE